MTPYFDDLDQDQIHQLTAVPATLKWLMNFRIVACMYTLLFFKFANHVYNMFYSIRTILNSFISHPLALYVLNTTSNEDVIMHLLTAPSPTQFASITVDDMKKEWLEWTGLGTDHKAFTLVFQTAEWLGVIDFHSVLDRANAEIALINAEMLHFFRQRDAFAGLGKWIAHIILIVILLILIFNTIRRVIRKRMRCKIYI